MSFIDRAKDKIDHVMATASDEAAARDEKAESDVAPDRHVAGSRAGSDDTDGEYVGRSTPAFDAEVQESGAEARSEEKRLSQ